MLKAKDQSFTA